MSVQAMSAAFAVKVDNPTAKLVLLALANYADQDGRCWPSQKKLCEVTSLSERAVRNAMDVLESLSLITKTPRRRSDGSRASDVVHLVFLQPAPTAACDQPAPDAGYQPARRAPPPAPRAGLTTFEPSKEPTLSPRPAAERVSQAMEAAGDALASIAVCPGVASIARLNALLKGDPPCDWEDDVLPAIASAAAWHRSKGGAGSMRSWETAARIAVENRDARLTGAPANPSQKPRVVHDDDFWRAAMRNRARDPTCWSPRMGPEPGQPNCEVPDHILAEFEIRSAA